VKSGDDRAHASRSDLFSVNLYGDEGSAKTKYLATKHKIFRTWWWHGRVRRKTMLDRKARASMVVGGECFNSIGRKGLSPSSLPIQPHVAVGPTLKRNITTARTSTSFAFRFHSTRLIFLGLQPRNTSYQLPLSRADAVDSHPEILVTTALHTYPAELLLPPRRWWVLRPLCLS
jgi:hypothetical protein